MSDEFKKLDTFMQMHKPASQARPKRKLPLPISQTKSLVGGSLLALGLATFFIFQTQRPIITDEADLQFLEENLSAPITNDEYPEEVLDAMEIIE